MGIMVIFPLQLREDHNLNSFNVDLGEEAAYEISAAVKKQQDSGDTDEACEAEIAMKTNKLGQWY